MQVIAKGTVEASVVTAEGACGCTIRELITDRDGAPTFAMRQFEIEPGGHTPFHAHPWEHEVYILSGTGMVRTDAGPRPFGPGDAVLILPEENHSFVNSGDATLRFLCMIPVAQVCCR